MILEEFPPGLSGPPELLHMDSRYKGIQLPAGNCSGPHSCCDWTHPWPWASWPSANRVLIFGLNFVSCELGQWSQKSQGGDGWKALVSHRPLYREPILKQLAWLGVLGQVADLSGPQLPPPESGMIPPTLQAWSSVLTGGQHLAGVEGRSS